MRFQLLTLEGVKFDGEAREVSLATEAGRIAVLPHHEPMAAVAASGHVAVSHGHGEELFATFGGIIEVDDAGDVRLLADEADRADDLVETEIEVALARAQELTDHANTAHELHQARELAGRASVRLEVARMHRRRRQY